jgi:hypothetical protein
VGFAHFTSFFICVFLISLYLSAVPSFEEFPAVMGNVSEPGSSVSMMSGYGLDDRAIGVQSPTEAKDFSSNLCVQTGSGVHPASCTMGTGDPFPGGKVRPGRDADHSPPSSAEVVNK